MRIQRENERKIIVRLVGGLGNQLFQLSAGLFMRETHSGKILVDTSALERVKERGIATPRNFSLAELFPRIERLNPIEISEISNVIVRGAAMEGLSALGTIIARLSHAIDRFQKTRSAYSEGLGFDILQTSHPNSRSIYLSGYWQSLEIAEKVKHIMRSEIVMPANTSPQKKDVAFLLSRPTVAAIHIRRGDFFGRHKAIYGVTDIAYFMSGINFLKNKGVSEFFFFSDDREWCQRSFPRDSRYHFLEQNLDYPSVDFWTMTHASNVVISNSSFSWWAAIMSNAQTIIRPKQWTRTDNSERSIYPSDWIEL